MFVCLFKAGKFPQSGSEPGHTVFLAEMSGKSTLAWRGNEQQRVKGEQQLQILVMRLCTLKYQIMIWK